MGISLEKQKADPSPQNRTMMAPQEKVASQLKGRKRWKRGLLIALSGVDGSGKSTQVKLLQEKLAENQIESRRVWCRWRPITSLPLLFVLRHLGYAKVHQTSSIGFVETRIPERNGLALLWAILTQVDNFLKTGLMVMIPLAQGKTVICDRYVLDLTVESTADMKSSDRTATRKVPRLLQFLPHPRQSFLMVVDPRVAFQRKPDMPTLSHFVTRTELYRELADTLGVMVLDGSQPSEKIHDQIWTRISQDWMDERPS